MITILFRTLILYILIVVVLRLMGKREISQMEPFELVIMLIIADLAQTPMSNTGVPLVYGAIPILGIFVLHGLTSLLISKSKTARKLICGSSSIVIDRGIVCTKELKRLCYTLDEMMAQLRAKGIASVDEVYYAILEINGDLSVIPKGANRPVTPGDMNMKVSEAHLQTVEELRKALHKGS